MAAGKVPHLAHRDIARLEGRMRHVGPLPLGLGQLAGPCLLQHQQASCHLHQGVCYLTKAQQLVDSQCMKSLCLMGRQPSRTSHDQAKIAIHGVET